MVVMRCIRLTSSQGPALTHMVRNLRSPARMFSEQTTAQPYASSGTKDGSSKHQTSGTTSQIHQTTGRDSNLQTSNTRANIQSAKQSHSQTTGQNSNPRPPGSSDKKLPISTERLNKNVTLIQHTSAPDGSRPLVLLLGWLFAKPAHLSKFSDFYTSLGFDVISVEILLGQLLRPKKVKAVMRNVLDLCHEGHRVKQPVICHALSVGGYMYGELINNVNDHSDEYGQFANRMRAQIFDSVIDFYGIPRGIANAVTQNERKQQKIKTSLEWYMDKFKSITSDYVRASEAFHDNVWKTPSLFVYSQADPVANPEHYERLAQTWRDSNIKAESVFWSTAAHVSTFKMHGDEYRSQVTEFLKNSGVQDINHNTDSPSMSQKQAQRITQ